MMKNDVMANLTVCGRFHYNHYVRHLYALGGLNRFYHSSKLSIDNMELGLPHDTGVNVYPKEYLVHLHARLLGHFLQNPAYGFYHDVWQAGVLRQWQAAPIFHYLLHGNCRKLIKRAKEDGALCIGEPVNSHPEDLHSLLNTEHERLGIKARYSSNLLDRRLIADAENSDYLLTGSEVVKRSFIRCGFPSDRIFVLPYGTDTNRFSPLSNEERQQRISGLRDVSFRVICVGQITPRKGHVYLLDAWRKLNFPNAELLFVGRVDPLMKPVLARYEGVFRHVPHVPHHLLRHYYGVSDVFALPSLEDGFAYVCTEALGCGLPVIATDNTGASELLSGGVDGFVIPTHSSKQIAEKLQLLFEDTELRKHMSDSAVHKAGDSLLWDDYAKKLFSLYKQLCSVR